MLDQKHKIFLEDLEVDLWERCNLSCAQCTHNSPYFDSTDDVYHLEQFKKDIKALSEIAHIGSFRIVGGEPLLNKNLVEYVKCIKEFNFANYVTIFTNGLVLGHTNNDVFSYIDRLRISVYTNLEKKKLDLIYSNIDKIQTLYPHLNVASNKLSHFSYFNLATKNTNEELVDKIYNKCYYSYEHKGFSIFNGRFYKCFASRKKYNFLKNHSKENNFEHLKEGTHDSISLIELTKEKLHTYVSSKTPLEGCKWCLGTCGRQFDHKQIQTEKEEPATLEDLDFEEGEAYLSNLLLSWSLTDPELKNIKNNDFFDIKHLKNFLKHFKFRT